MLTVCPASSVYETASRLFQSAIGMLLSELRRQRHQQAVDGRSVGDRYEDVDAAIGSCGRDLGVVGIVAGGLRDAEDLQHRDPDLVGVDHRAPLEWAEDPVEAGLQLRHSRPGDARV